MKYQKNTHMSPQSESKPILEDRRVEECRGRLKAATPAATDDLTDKNHLSARQGCQRLC